LKANPDIATLDVHFFLEDLSFLVTARLLMHIRHNVVCYIIKFFSSSPSSTDLADECVAVAAKLGTALGQHPSLYKISLHANNSLVNSDCD